MNIQLNYYMLFPWVGLLLAGCGSVTTTTKDLSGFDEFRMDISFPDPPDCPCSDCPLFARITRLSNGNYQVEFEGLSRNLTEDESQRMKDLFQNVEFENTLLQCLTRSAPFLTCRMSFIWDTVSGANSTVATNFPCSAGATPMTEEQVTRTLEFVTDLLTNVQP